MYIIIIINKGRGGGGPQSPYPHLFLPNIPKSTPNFCQIHHLQEISQSAIYRENVVLPRFFLEPVFDSYKLFWTLTPATLLLLN